LNCACSRTGSGQFMRQDKTIFIRADAKLPYSRVIELIDIAKGAGVEVLGIIPEYFTEEET